MRFSDIKRWFRARSTEMQLSSLAVGMNSSVDLARDLHVLFLDYDIRNIADVEESVRELQSFWRLGEARIFKTRNGFHVFFFYDIMPYERARMIVGFAKFVDPLFKQISYYYDHKSIRVAGKYQHRDIRFVKRIDGVRIPSSVERQLGDMKAAEHSFFLDNLKISRETGDIKKR